jgi:hypothetical protein
MEEPTVEGEQRNFAWVTNILKRSGDADPSKYSPSPNRKPGTPPASKVEVPDTTGVDEDTIRSFVRKSAVADTKKLVAGTGLMKVSGFFVVKVMNSVNTRF